MQTIVKSAIAVGLAGIFAVVAIAATGPTDTIKARQANFKQIGGNFKVIRDEVNAPAPDMAKIKAATGQLKTLGAALPTWFPAGTGPESGVKTGAKAEIWSDAPGFAAAAKKLADATAKIDAATDVAGVKAVMMEVGGACGGCHKAYRVEEKH